MPLLINKFWIKISISSLHALLDNILANIVMKLTKCKMNEKQPLYDCIKLSDDKGKHLGNEKEVEICKYECGIL